MLISIVCGMRITSFAGEETVYPVSIKLGKTKKEELGYHCDRLIIEPKPVFPKNSDSYLCNFDLTVSSSNDDVVEYYNENKNFFIKGLGSCTLTFKAKNGVKAQRKVSVKKLYYMGIVGQSYPLPTINGKRYNKWKISNKKCIKKVKGKARYKCLKSSKKSIVLSKKIKGVTYRLYVLPKTKQQLRKYTKTHDYLLVSDDAFYKNANKNIVREDIHITSKYLKDGGALRTGNYIIFKDKASPTGYSAAGSTGVIYNTAKGMRYFSAIGGGDGPVKKSDLDKPYIPGYSLG